MLTIFVNLIPIGRALVIEETEPMDVSISFVNCCELKRPVRGGGLMDQRLGGVAWVAVVLKGMVDECRRPEGRRYGAGRLARASLRTVLL